MARRPLLPLLVVMAAAVAVQASPLYLEADEAEMAVVEPLPLLGASASLGPPPSMLELEGLAAAGVGCPAGTASGSPCCPDQGNCPVAYVAATCCQTVCCPSGSACLPAGGGCGRNTTSPSLLTAKAKRTDARLTSGRAIPEALAKDEVPVTVVDGLGRVQRMYTPPPAAPVNHHGSKPYEKTAADGVVETPFRVNFTFHVENFLYTHYTLSAANHDAVHAALRKDISEWLAAPVKYCRVNAVSGVRMATPGAAAEEKIRPSLRHRTLAAVRKLNGGGPRAALLEAGAGYDMITGVEVRAACYARTPGFSGKMAREAFNRLGKLDLPLKALQHLPLDARGNNARLFKLSPGFNVTYDDEPIRKAEDVEPITKRLQLEYIHTVRKDPSHVWKDLTPSKWRLDAGDAKSLSVVTKPVLAPFEQSFRIDSLHHDGATVSRLFPDGFDGVRFRFVISFYDDSVGDQRNDWVGVGGDAKPGSPAMFHNYVIGLFHDPFYYSFYPAPNWKASRVRRSVGWHLFEFIGSSKEVHYFIDGKHVHTAEAVTKVTGFSLRGNGGTVALWTPWELYKPVKIKNW